MASEFSIIRFQVANFHSVLLNSRPFQPIATHLIKIVRALIDCETEPDKKMKTRIEWIYQNTHRDVNEHLSIIEIAVFRNLDKGLNKEIEIGDRKTFSIAFLYKCLDEVTSELSEMVTKISKKYNLDYPVTQIGASQPIDLTK